MSIDYSVDNGVAVITINRPEKLNACTPEMSLEIADHLRRIDADSSIRVGVVTGSGGRAFSAGADLAAINDEAEKDEPYQWHALRQETFNTGQEVQTPLIAAIDGYCLGGGVELSLLCDIRIAGEGAQFGLPEVKRNLISGYAAVTLPSVVGLSNALYLLLTGRFIDATEARRIGLVQEVVGSGKALDRATELAAEIAAHGPLAVRLSKELAIRSRDMSVLDGLRTYRSFHGMIAGSQDLREGTRAFLERRPADFS